DINRTSLHDFYRWRLAGAYAVTRDAAAAGTAAACEELFATAARTRLSELGDDQRSRFLRGDQPGPQLVIAPTANINANREVPPRRGGFCLAFASDNVTLRADPRSGEPNVEAKTADYEHLLGHARFTLFDVVAISGAAFSPLMGAATRGAYRIVLTLTNLRLGIWMPHPDVVRRARAYLDTPPDLRRDDRWWTKSPLLLLAWDAGRHPFWHRGPGRRPTAPERGGAALGTRARPARAQHPGRGLGACQQAAARGSVLASDAANPRHALGGGRRAHQLPRYLGQRDRRRSLRQPWPGGGAAPWRQEHRRARRQR